MTLGLPLLMFEQIHGSANGTKYHQEVRQIGKAFFVSRSQLLSVYGFVVPNSVQEPNVCVTLQPTSALQFAQPCTCLPFFAVLVSGFYGTQHLQLQLDWLFIFGDSICLYH